MNTRPKGGVVFPSVTCFETKTQREWKTEGEGGDQKGEQGLEGGVTASTTKPSQKVKS